MDHGHLYVFAHGNPGFLELCREGVSGANVASTSVLQGMFRSIRLISCAVASGPEGQNFCLALARFTMADVVASMVNQVGRNVGYFIDWGRWEGVTQRFTPNGRIKLEGWGGPLG